MSVHEHENAQEEQRCLQAVRDIIKARRDLRRDVGAIIIEPITSYNNLVATPNFYRGLRKIASENQIPFVVDETRTGVGITGKMWGHENWYLNQAPDIITFGGKVGLSGFYTTPTYRPSAHEGVNVDLNSVLLFGNTWRYIQRKNLLNYVNDTSTFLKIELDRVNRQNGAASNIRGQGTFLGFDVPNEWQAAKIQVWLQRQGIHLLRCGPTTFGLRPSLLLGPKQASHLRDGLMYYSPLFQRD